MLQEWQDSYRLSAHEVIKGHIPSRSGEELVDRIATTLRPHSTPYAFTGLAAAWRLAPMSGFRLVTVYTPLARDTTLWKSLEWREGDEGSNTWLIRPNDEGVFYAARDIGGVRCVSAVQTYLDLQRMPERAKEAADHLRQERVQWRR